MKRLQLLLLMTILLGGCASTKTLRPFTTDGCSLFPDGNWESCCVTHDRAYWQGGTAAQRKEADLALRSCVAEVAGKPTLAGAMYYGVRVGGTPYLPMWYRWGYGWGYGRGYEPLNADELLQVQKLMPAEAASQAPAK